MNPGSARVTIAISSYNYERFVAQTIESALGQTHPNVEVIVVDDGSTDGSWDVIQRFVERDGDRITAIRSPNRGQGSAYNIGFERSSGEWVLFLDSDDMLHPDTVARCLAAARGDTSIVEFRLRLIGADSQPLGSETPYTMHSGDVTPIIRRFGTYAGPPSCGNFYRRSAIAPYFPVPAERWRGSVDTVPFIVAAFHGQIVSLPEALASYRLHRASSARMGLMGNMSKTMSEELLMQQSRQREVLALLRERSGIDIRGPFLPLPWNVRARALAWRLEPDQPSVDGPESAMRLIRDQWRSVRAWPGYGPIDQILQCTWTAAVALLPRLALAPLARGNASSGLRANLRRLFARVQ
jgi:Glycosyl transferase family 2